MNAVSGGRYLILNDANQQMPTERLKVRGAEMRKTNAGNDYPVLLLQGEDGNEYAASAWPRDVEQCIRQWNNDPELWGYVAIVKNGNRYAIVPAPDQKPREERIGA